MNGSKRLKAPEACPEEKKRRAGESIKRRAQKVVEERMRLAGSNAGIPALCKSLPAQLLVPQ